MSDPIPSDVTVHRRRIGVLPCTAPLPTPDEMRARLTADGWEERPLRYPEVSLYVKAVPDFDGPLELVMAKGRELPDGYVSYVLGALRTISDLEGRDRPIGDVAAEIVAAADRGHSTGDAAVAARQPG